MGVTIKDVAKQAGVSVTSASYALNGTGYVSPEKILRVQEAARELGYVPNGIARMLRQKSKHLVGYFSYSLAGPFFGEIMRGLEDTFLPTDWELVACTCSPEKKDVSLFLRERMVEGAIISVEHLGNDFVQHIASEECPIVVMDRELCEEHISSILVANQDGAYSMGQYLHNLGVRTVGVVDGSGYDGEQRAIGFLRAVKDFGLELWEDWTLHGHFQEHLAYERVSERLQKDRRLPQALFAFSDEMAVGAMKALQEAGLRIPEDISVLGMDDLAVASYVKPPLTTYHRHVYDMGVRAAETLLRMLDGERGSIQILPGYLVERGSCRSYK